MVSNSGKEIDSADLKFIRAIMQQPLLEEEQEQTLTQAWQDKNDQDAFKRLIWSYGRIVVSIASKFKHFGLPFNDLLQEGLLGLLVASQRYEADRGVRFSSYAKWWVRALIQDYVLRNWSIVRAGTTNQHKLLFFNLKRLKRQLNLISNELLSDEDKHKLAKSLNVAITDIELIEQKLLAGDFSLNANLHKDSEDIWQDLLEDDVDSPEQQSINRNTAKQFIKWVHKALDSLSSREREVITRRYLRSSKQTLSEIGQALNLTKERIRQIEARAIRKMRRHLFKNAHEIMWLLEE